jgi:pantetheine hydrolase
MIVYPEYGLMPLGMTRERAHLFMEPIPDPRSVSWNPCSEKGKETQVQNVLSCIAANNSIYIVANMGGTEPCEPESDPNCPSDNYYQYNTNVVFNTTGHLIARYRKYNLFMNEPIYNTPVTVDYTYFDTPYGRFGTFICFDIAFKEPGVTLIQELDVQHIVFPTAWMNELPYYSAVTFHQGFAIGLGVNLLGANIHYPQLDFCGSGIYGSNQTYAYRYDKQSLSSALLVHSIPVSPNKIVQKQTTFPDSLQNEVEFQSPIFEDLFNLVQIKSNSDSVSVCHNGLCCLLHYTRLSVSDDIYALGAFKGLHTFEGQYYLEICTFLRCLETNTSVCNEDATSSSTHFSFLNMTGNFTTKYVYPMVVTSGVDPSSGDWEYTGQYVLSYGTRKPFVSASMYGRRFDLDDGVVPSNGVRLIKIDIIFFNNAVVVYFLTVLFA